ncbi:hypothetical protein TPR58_03770 [Sphingomonas sp. HF-S3]|uniref:TonB-dependent receptor n=1 Tax=Sphingomonas rustica TaxID=3103142 RepID=A0ABV0B3X3_9SPHN
MSASAVCLLVCLAAPAAAQQAPGPDPVAPDPSGDGQPHSDIVVIGQRGSAVTDLPPLAEFDAAAVAATGATTVPELLQAIRGSTQGADGAEPILLLNAQRVSGYSEIASLPPEAIEKVEVMPEQAALKFGFPPTRRLVNFITKARFRQVEVKASAGTATRGGTTMQKANIGLTRLNQGARLTLGLELRRVDALLQSDRTILPDPDVPFDAIGNITGVGGGEIDPALSAAAGQAVTIAPVPVAPADRDSLLAYAASGNRPRLFDPGPYRTLAPGTEAIKADMVIADRIGETLSGSISLSAGHSRDRSLGGPAGVRLLIPATNPYSPFGGPVVLNRYLIEAGALDQRQTVTDLNAGALLRGAIAGWRWDVTANFDQKRTAGVVERGVDVTAANAAIAAGADPFAPLTPELAPLLVDRIVQRTRTTGAKAVATNAPIRLPAGKVTVTATAEVSRDSAVSSLRGQFPSDLALARTRVEGGLAIDVPLTSRRENILSFIGDLSVNASLNVRHVGGFGSLDDSVFGLSWGPVTGVQVIAALRRSATAPDMAQQSTPITRVPNVPVFDFGTGRTEITTLITGGNPDLLAERRLVRSFTLSLKPFAKREWRINATYEATTIRDQTGTVQAITPRTEAILPDLFVRDAGGRLTSVVYQPINFDVEEVRTLNLTVNATGQFAKAPAAAGQPPRSSTYYGGIGPSLKFSDRLKLRPDTPELDLLAGDTVRGWGMPRFYGYAYGGINHRGMGLTFNAWYQAPNRILSDDPAGNLRFSSLFKLNLGAYVGLGQVLKDRKWARKLRLGLDIDNATDARQRVTDGNGLTPNRFQRDYLEPVGRTVTLSLRRLF